jgi:hypothetical protein
LHKPEVFASLTRYTDVKLIGTHLVISLEGNAEVTEPTPAINTRAVLLRLKRDSEFEEGSKNFILSTPGGACQLVEGEFEEGVRG